ncbi:MAG: Beta-lactamase family protein [Cyanobacteriota bacterium erpe_2018_sw_21hr_WHONDRS-SW48-000092_B_bin.40]|jgi:CubicO group peptidase (beta-lactamase class C family)|nr:Beta-lactamase family protein [Cyanobacteriota bacterium erpe_2018_sw_21hr_WHONDRS-SW48-000092_B_bin.40]
MKTIESNTIDRGHLLQAGLDVDCITRLFARLEDDVAAHKYPGAAIALARHGQVVVSGNFGQARLATNEMPAQKADSNTLWLLYSQTKPITSCAIWILAERGELSLHTPVAFYIPEFAKHGKENLTAYHLLTHQAGFPNAMVPEEAWADHELLSQSVCDFKLDFEPGSKVFYHSYAAHWVLAVLIEAITKKDFRQFISEEILKPLALHDFFVGVPESQQHRLAGAYYCPDANEPTNHLTDINFDKKSFYQSGMPGAGGYASASDVALFYQMLLGLGSLNGTRLLSPHMVQYATRNHTEDRIDHFFGTPMHRAMGVHVRGNTPTIRGLGSTAPAEAFGHGGVGTSYSFADPTSGVSFTYLTNSRLTEPSHSKRLDEIVTMAHAAINLI